MTHKLEAPAGSLTYAMHRNRALGIETSSSVARNAAGSEKQAMEVLSRMTGKNSEIDRRKFLKVGSAGLVGLGAGPRWAGSLAFGEPPQRRRPVNPVVIKSAQLEIVLDRTDALPFEYRLPALRTRMRGEDRGGQMTATLCRRKPWGFVTSLTEASSVDATDTQADFQL